MAKLTEKQKRFCDYYIETTNATEAAKRAGYSEKTAYAIGVENLRKPQIEEYIRTRLDQMDKERVASAEEVLAYLTSVLRGEETEQVLKGVGEGAQRLVDKEPNIKDRIKAAELLAKRHGLLTDKLDINGAVPVVIANDDGLED